MWVPVLPRTVRAKLITSCRLAIFQVKPPRPILAAVRFSSGSGTTPEATSDTSQYMSPVITSTPNYDGYVYHTVQSGQTLFQIALAYGVTVDYLKELNSLSDETMIYTGQTLKIMQAATPTVTPTFTPTPVYPTRTPSPAEITATPTLMPTPTTTPTPTLLDQLPTFDRQTFGFLLIILSALGLGVIVFFSFFKKPGAAPSASAPTPQPVAPEPEAPKKKRTSQKATESVSKITEPAAAPAKARTKKAGHCEPTRRSRAGCSGREEEQPQTESACCRIDLYSRSGNSQAGS